MNYAVIEGVFDGDSRTIYHNPNDIFEIQSLIKSDDIKTIATDSIPIGNCIITDDIKFDLRLSFGSTNEDFFNNEITCIAIQYFI